MAADNLLMWNIAAGETFTIPEGFLFASIYPSSGATYTITNSLNGEITNVSLKISPAINTVFTFPNAPSLSGWTNHVISASSGSVLVVYANGS
jgi:hypothetical protein